MKRAALTLLFGLLWVAAAPAGAQSSAGFSAARFHPAPGPSNYLEVEGTSLAPHLRPSVGLFFDYAASPLVVDKPCSAISNVDPSCNNEDRAMLKAIGLLHVLGSLSLHEKVQLGLDLPLGVTDAGLFATRRASSSGGASPAVTVAPADGFALADARVSVKGIVLGEPGETMRIATTAFSSLPTAALTDEHDCSSADACSYLGERGVEAGVRATGEFLIDELRLATSVGGSYRPKRHLLDAKSGSEVSFAVAGKYAFTPKVAALAEVVCAAGVAGQGDLPVEARGAFQFGRDLTLTAGAGAGLTGATGVPDVRALLGVQWTFVSRDEDHDGLEDRSDECPTESEDRDGFQDGDGCPEPDNDQDHVVDADDRCPDQAEDGDGFDDGDGCPDPDNDGDGVPDGYDACEGAREDLDGDRDDDGCPDVDIDRDSVPDSVDRCLNEPEDTDGLADDDGCPEDDADGDGLLDPDDPCPDATEWWNGILDQDGCPEDDEDQDSVPDAIDRCPRSAETLNGKEDGDGCPDGPIVIALKGQRLLFSRPPDLLPGSPELWNTTAAVDAVTAYVRRNHQRGSLRIVMLSSANDALAAPRAAALAELLRAQLPRTEITSTALVGDPARFEIELLPPGWSELSRPRAQVAPNAP